MKNKNNIYYHYCSLKSFDAIINSKEMYLSDPLKMNDTMELMWGLNTLEILNNINESDNKDIDFIYKIKKYLKIQGNSQVFIASFSSKSDDLSQWRGYADDGKGVAIGFNLNKISKRSDINDFDINYKNLSEQLQIKYIYNDIYKVLNNFFEVSNKKMEQTAMRRRVGAILPELAKYKNSTFEIESERRLLYNERSNCERDDKLKHYFRVTNKGDDIIEYVKLPIDLSSIDSIIIGPNSRITKRIMVDYLKSKDIHIRKIYKSNSTYIGN